MRKVRNFNVLYLVPRFWLLFDEKVQLVNYQKKSLSPISSCLLIVRMYGTYKSFNLNQQVVRYINLEVHHDITTFLKRASFQTHGNYAIIGINYARDWYILSCMMMKMIRIIQEQGAYREILTQKVRILTKFWPSFIQTSDIILTNQGVILTQK